MIDSAFSCEPQVMIHDLFWATVISLVYWSVDLSSHQLVLSMEKSTALKLGYNVSSANFLLASIFISVAVILLIHFPLVMILSMFTEEEPKAIHSEWTVFVILASLRFGYDIHKVLRNPTPGRKLP